MNRLISVVLLVLLVASSGFAAWQYSENQRLAIENTQLKNELDKVSSKLADTDAERMNLEHELSQKGQQLHATEIQVAQLQAKIAQLEENITALRQQLQDKAMREGATTIGLTFLWHPSIQIYNSSLSATVRRMNAVIWHRLKVYFFIYYAGPRDFMPKTISLCGAGSHSLGSISWAEDAWSLFPDKDIPIGIFADVDHLKYLGCEFKTRSSMPSIAVDFGGLTHADFYKTASQLLSHEILHAFGISDREIDEQMGGLSDVIPIVWLSRIQSQARRFQMALPSTEMD